MGIFEIGEGSLIGGGFLDMFLLYIVINVFGYKIIWLIEKILFVFCLVKVIKIGMWLCELVVDCIIFFILRIL